jgi:hypothetical protein
MGGGTQANDLRTQLDSAVIAVMCDVVQCDMNRHGVPPASLSVFESAQDLCHAEAWALSRNAQGSTAPKSGDAGKWIEEVAPKCGEDQKIAACGSSYRETHDPM